MLTEEQTQEIKQRFTQGVSRRALAKEYGVSREEIEQVVKVKADRSVELKPVEGLELLEGYERLRKQFFEAKTRQTGEEIQTEMASFCAEVLGRLSMWVQVGKRATFAEGGLLCFVENHWEDLDPMHGQYESFHDFAAQVTGEEYSTFRTKMNVFRTFVLNEGGDSVIAERGPDVFLDVPLGKLQKALGTIHKNAMSPENWDALLDENVSDREFHHLIWHGASQEDQDKFVAEGGQPDFTVDMNSGALHYWPSGGKLAIKVGQLAVTAKEREVLEVVDMLIERSGIRRRE